MPSGGLELDRFKPAPVRTGSDVQTLTATVTYDSDLDPKALKALSFVQVGFGLSTKRGWSADVQARPGIFFCSRGGRAGGQVHTIKVTTAPFVSPEKDF